MKKIVTTVGTSLFTNYQDDGVRNHYGRSYAPMNDPYKATQEAHATDIFKDDLRPYISKIREKIEDFWFEYKNEPNKNASAEIASILKIVEDEDEPEETFEVHLLATDTLQSVLAAELIVGWFEKYKQQQISKVLFQRQPDLFEQQGQSDHTVKNLRTDNQENFESGIMNLLEVLNRVSTKETLLNITGGYKAIVPIVTIWAQIKKIPVKYLYKESELEKGDIQLLTLENLPVNFDYSLFEDNYLAFESIKPSKQIQNLPDYQNFTAALTDPNHFKILKNAYIIQENGGKVRLTPLGDMLYKQYDDSLKEDGFNMSNLVGKVMEVKVFEYFKRKHKDDLVILGKPIGSSPEGNPYDLDVFVETDNEIWGIEVKPEGVFILIKEEMDDRKKKSTIEYKCKTGAFKCALDEYTSKNLKLCLIIYHHKEPNKYLVEDMKTLNQMENNPCRDNLVWWWVRPEENYKGNVNWKLQSTRIKYFDFAIGQWKLYE